MRAAVLSSRATALGPYPERSHDRRPRCATLLGLGAAARARPTPPATVPRRGRHAFQGRARTVRICLCGARTGGACQPRRRGLHRPGNGGSLRAGARGDLASAGHAAVSHSAHRCTHHARQPSGGNGHRRGEDPGRRGRGSHCGTGRHAGTRRHLQRLPGGSRRSPPRPGLSPAGADRGRGDAPAGSGSTPCCLRRRHRLLYRQGADLRLSARPSGAATPAQRAARPRASPRNRSGRVERAAAARVVDGIGRRGRQHPDRRSAHPAHPVATAREPAAAGLCPGSVAHRFAPRSGPRFSSRSLDSAGRADGRRTHAPGRAGQGHGRALAGPPPPRRDRRSRRWWPIICCSAISTTWCAIARS